MQLGNAADLAGAAVPARWPYIAWKQPPEIAAWTQFTGPQGRADGSVELRCCSACAAVDAAVAAAADRRAGGLPALPAHAHAEANRVGWWTAVIGTRPRLGGARRHSNYSPARSSPCALRSPGRRIRRRPTSRRTMYHASRSARPSTRRPSRWCSTGIFVIVCQLKINVTNAYAGSIAWSNFFSRLTHSASGPRGVAGVQRGAGAAAHGDRHLPRHREHPASSTRTSPPAGSAR